MSVGSVAVVGGGPAGLIAAEHLAAAGMAVKIYEGRRSVGRKFLLAGRSGLNLTTSEPVEVLVGQYSAAPALLKDALTRFTPGDLRDWSAGLGETTFVGSSGRVFPHSMRATPLLRAWLGRLVEQGIEVQTSHRWLGWDTHEALQFRAGDADLVVEADAVVFALGGASWPRVGSDGSWAAVFAAAGIEITPLVASNCGVQVQWSAVMVERFAGEPVKNIACTCGGSPPMRGDVVITETGLEGGPIYALGPEVRQSLIAGDTQLLLDTAPDLTTKQLAVRLSKRRPKASAASWLRSAGIAPVVVSLAREATANQLPASAAAMAELLKRLPLEVSGLAPIDRAISTAGGVAFDQLDDHFMVKHRPGTFVAGEMLDWDAPTGGYLLQACFSTGVAAAHGVLAYLS